MQAEIALSSHASPTQLLDPNSRTQSVWNLATKKFLLTASAESLYAFFFCFQTSSEPWSCPHLWRWTKWVGLSQGSKYARRWVRDCTPAFFCFKHPLSQQDENWHDSEVRRLQRLEKNIGFWGPCPTATAKPLDLAHVALLQSSLSVHQQQTLHQNSTRTRGLLVSSHTSPNQRHECKTPAAAFGQQKFFLATNTVAASTESVYAFFVLVTSSAPTRWKQRRLTWLESLTKGCIKPLDLALVAPLQPPVSNKILGFLLKSRPSAAITAAISACLPNAIGLLISSHNSSNRLQDCMTHNNMMKPSDLRAKQFFLAANGV